MRPQKANASGALLNDPGWVSTEITPSPILTAEGNWQRDDSRHPVRVATRVARDAIFQDLFAKLARP